MKASYWVRLLMATGLAGGVLTEVQCGPMLKDSVRTGIYQWVTGGQSGLGVGDIGGLLTDFLTGVGGLIRL